MLTRIFLVVSAFLSKIVMVRRRLLVVFVLSVSCFAILFGTAQTEVVKNTYDITLDDPSIAAFVVVMISMALLAKLSQDSLVYDWDAKKYISKS